MEVRWEYNMIMMLHNNRCLIKIFAAFHIYEVIIFVRTQVAFNESECNACNVYLKIMLV